MSSVFGLKARPQIAIGLALQRLEVPLELLHEHELLPLIHRFDGLQHLEVVLLVRREAHQRLDVFREAAAAVTDAGKQERRTDAAIGPDRLPHAIHVRAKQLADIGDLVHERDAGREKRVGGVLRQLRARAVHDHDRRAGTGEWLIQRDHHVGAALILGADDHAIGLHEVVNRRALLEEFGIADHGERVLGLAGDDLADALRGPDRNRALVDNHPVAVHRLADVAGHRFDVLEIGGPILALRRPDRDENDL